MAIPISSSLTQLNAEAFISEGYELSLDNIIPSIELTGSFTPFQSKTQLFIYDIFQNVLHENSNYNAVGSYLTPPVTTANSNTSSSYNQFELNPTKDIYDQGYSSGEYYAVYNFIDYELGSENSEEIEGIYQSHPYFISEISGDRTELRIQNNFLSQNQIESYYNQFNDKLNARENVDEFYISFGNNRNFIAVNSQLVSPSSGSIRPTSILIKLYKPLPINFEIETEIQIISKVGESRVFKVEFQPNLEFVDNLLSLKGPNYNIDLKDKINNSTNFKNLNDLINTANSESYYQFNSLRDQKGVILRKDWSDWSQFINYSSAEQRLNNFYNKMVSIESASAEISSLEDIGSLNKTTSEYSSSYNNASNTINNIISKFDSYEYFLYYITGSESWPKYTSTYPYANFSVTSSVIKNWFGSTDESNPYYNTGKNQIYSASRYDNNNQNYLYYLIPPFITDNSSNEQYTTFVNMTGQAFDEMYLYTEAVEQIRNTNSSLTGDVLPLGLADDVIESLGFETYGNSFNSIGFNPNQIAVVPSAGSGLEYITRYIDIASGSVINYYDQQESTLGYVIALADPSFPYPIDNAAQEIYKRIFHNMVSLVKRKGTVTGLRQLINIWGVPSTMLRISEFGGKNKDDENDYDLWMNRYSSALKTYSGSLVKNTATTIGTQASSSVQIPWLPLTNNFYDENSPSANYMSVPDCIQFRFKNKKPIGPDQFFTSSLLIKPWFDGAGGNIPNSPGAFGLVLEYSGSNSGSFSGSALPTDSQYGTLQFVISGSAADGGTEGTQTTGRHYFTSSKISLPFFDDGWWSVQLQRLTNLSASNQDNTLNEYELRVANNIYDGYDGNQIGFQASASITMIDNKISSSINEAWNNMGFDVVNAGTNKKGLGLGGIAPFDGDFGNGTNNLIGSAGIKNPMKVGGKFIGRPFVGEFQEFRYYRRAMSASSFNDYVMNPESIQGHSDSNTGAGSSYDLLSFRAPLGNELEFVYQPVGFRHIFSATGNYSNPVNDFFAGQNVAGTDKGVGSIHPSIVNSTGELFTSSFLQNPSVSSTRGFATSSFYNWKIAVGPDNQYITASWFTPNTEINYMDQPAAGIRNRIKNKIQVIDGNEYGTTLSPFRSIQQEFEQSSSYTEDLNSLEVGFSFQNEINDDIIATFGHGVVSDAIADPRFLSESTDRYPELTRIAEDYFKKYQGFNVNNTVQNNSPVTLIPQEFDYNRLIQFYETSLFKAIKNYVPARTSLSTGIIVKQHLLERNNASTVIGVNPNTSVAKTPETGSNVYGYTDQTGFNSVISQRNLLITSSIPMETLTGSAGGSVNKYNNLKVNTLNFNPNQPTFRCIELDNIDIGNGFVNLFGSNPTLFTGLIDNIVFSNENGGYLETLVAYKGQLLYDFSIASGTGTNNINIEIRSNKRGVISRFSAPVVAFNTPRTFSPFFDIYPNEEIKIFAKDDLNDLVLNSFQIEIGVMLLASPLTTLGGQSVIATSASQQFYYTLDNFTGDTIVKDTQDEFYNGEFSGSNFEVIPPQYNPYRIFADGNDKTPDIIPPTPYVDFTKGGERGTTGAFTATNANTIVVDTNGVTVTNDYEAFTGSFFNLQEGQEYEVSISYTSNQFNYDQVLILGFNQMTTTSFPSSNTFQYWQGANLTGAPASAGPITTLLLIPPAFNASTTVTSFTYNTTAGTAYNSNNGIQFYNSSLSANQTSTITVNYIRAINSLGPKHFYERDGFTIVPSQSQLFQNSPYNPTINNVSGSRENSFLFDMDFDPVIPGSSQTEGIPSDYSLLISSSELGFKGATSTNINLLEYAEVPESNYTTTTIINPRYDGSKITSADYNFRITEANLSESQEPSGLFSPLMVPDLKLQSKIRFLNDDTGSWEGDKTSEYISAIDNRPINFAHFKSSYENLEKFGTSTFEIDQLISIPFESIQGEQAPIITSSQLTGNNENLIPVASTFPPNRKLKVVYNQSTKQFRNLTSFLTPTISEIISPVLDYSNLTNISKYIYTPAQDIASSFTNQKTPFELLQTQSFNAPNWTDVSVNHNKSAGATAPLWNILSTKNDTPINSDRFLVTQSILPSPRFSDTNSLVLFQTGSSPSSKNKGHGLLYVMGYATNAEDLYQYNFPGVATIVKLDMNGPHLQLINSANHNINNGNIAYTSSTQGWATAPNATVSPNTQITSKDNVTAMYAGNEGGNFFPWPWCSSTFVEDTAGTIGVSQTRLPDLPITQDGTRGIENYFTYNYSQSAATEYTDKNLPAMIEKGDIIRVTYAFPSAIDATDNGGVDFNSLSNNELVNVDFTVLGYELAPPIVHIQAAYPYNGSSQIGWATGLSSTTSGNTFYADIRDLPPTGLYSPDSLKERYDLMIENGQPWVYVNDDGNNSNAATGSLLNCEVITRWGEQSASSGIIAPTGSLRLTLQGWGSDFSTNEQGAIGTTQAFLRTGMEMGFNTSGNPITASWEGFDPKTSPAFSPSKFSGIVEDGSTYHPLDPGFVYDTLIVSPDPTTLPKPILSGSISAATIVKRVNDDTKVIVDMAQPINQKGAITPSGDGYLIPDDLSSTQQDNVQKIINVLKSQNSFTNPPDANETQDVS